MNNTLNELKKIRALLPADIDATIFCDMDGVLAQWDKACNPEIIYEKDYFYNLLLEPAMKEALLLLYEAGFPLNILSAAATEGYARGDKTRWLKKHGMECLPRLYSPLGRNKTETIDIKPNGVYVLLDDFNPNLIAWEGTEKNNAKFVAVKFLNGINGGSDVWKGRTIYHRSSGEAIAFELAETLLIAALTHNT